MIGAVAGNDFPLIESPITPASLSTIGTVWVTGPVLGGSAGSPTWNTPSIPLGTCTCASWCEWYMPSSGLLTVNSYVKLLPGSIGVWVMSGTPSIAKGTSMPWKWTPVDIGSLSSTTMRTWSPTSSLIAGPGTVPLKVHARTVLPGDTSQFASSAVRLNTFVPSGSTFGING